MATTAAGWPPLIGRRHRRPAGNVLPSRDPRPGAGPNQTPPLPHRSPRRAQDRNGLIGPPFRLRGGGRCSWLLGDARGTATAVGRLTASMSAAAPGAPRPRAIGRAVRRMWSVSGGGRFVFGLGDEVVDGVDDGQPAFVLADHSVGDEAGAGFDAGDAASAGEDEGDGAGAVGESDFEGGDVGAGFDADALNLAGEAAAVAVLGGGDGFASGRKFDVEAGLELVRRRLGTGSVMVGCAGGPASGGELGVVVRAGVVVRFPEDVGDDGDVDVGHAAHGADDLFGCAVVEEAVPEPP